MIFDAAADRNVERSVAAVQQAQSLSPGSYGPGYITYSNMTNGLGDFTHTVTLDASPRTLKSTAGSMSGQHSALPTLRNAFRV
jgi:hypothetical protein